MSRIICTRADPFHFALILFCNAAVLKYNVENEVKAWICHCVVTKQVRNKLSLTVVTWLGCSGWVELIVLILSTHFSAAISVLDYSVAAGQRERWQRSWLSIREGTNGKTHPIVLMWTPESMTTASSSSGRVPACLGQNCQLKICNSHCQSSSRLARNIWWCDVFLGLTIHMCWLLLDLGILC